MSRRFLRVSPLSAYPAAPSPRSTSVAALAERASTSVSSSRSRRLKV